MENPPEGKSLRYTRLGNLELRNPIMAASGCFGYGYDMAGVCDLSAIGGFVTKSVTLHPREGNPVPRIWETPSGMLNAIGLENGGLENFVSTLCPFLEKLDTTVLVNVAGFKTEEYVKVVERLEAEDAVDGFEINVSCPNVGSEFVSVGTDPVQTGKLLDELRPRTKKHLMVKLTPNVSSIIPPAKAAAEHGADSISLINTITGMSIDPASGGFRLANRTGGLSGPAIRPVAVKMVWEAAENVDIPIVGVGGIDSVDAALEFFYAGASAVQVGSSLFSDPALPEKIARGLEKVLETRGINITDIIGKAGK